MTLTRLYHTLHHLRPIQIFERLRRRVRKIDTQFELVPNIRKVSARWRNANLIQPRMVGEGEFLFLNKRGSLNQSMDWNNLKQSKLWLYNLHYFEDLVAIDASERRDWHRALVNSWIQDNPVLHGNGWEPYPQSLRIVNWIKWFKGGQAPEDRWLRSLAQQVYVLSQNLEYHLLGNHLFSNAKALIFAGLYFEGKYAEKWLAKGLAVLDHEVKEQILTDGGNFELTPMYHNIMFQDLLDLVNLFEVYQHSSTKKYIPTLRQAAAEMLGWMNSMVHPDGEIAFFNDAAMGVAPSPERLREYAEALGVTSENRGEVVRSSKVSACYLKASGYVRVESRAIVALLDCALIGPDYIPGHGHADNLSFELSLFGQRLFVNSGTSHYDLDEDRLYQRSTFSHNTIVVDGESSSDVWGSFRVGYRAYPFDVSVENKGEGCEVIASHNGYMRLPGSVIHQRRWLFEEDRIVITDNLIGSYTNAEARFYIHPDVKISFISDFEVSVALPTGEVLKLKFSQVCWRGESCWYPEFGKSVNNSCLKVKLVKPELRIEIIL